VAALTAEMIKQLGCDTTGLMMPGRMNGINWRSTTSTSR
jgi:hypothetical protein